MLQVVLGDTLVSVDDHDVHGISDDALAKLIIGPIGTKVACLNYSMLTKLQIAYSVAKPQNPALFYDTK